MLSFARLILTVITFTSVSSLAELKVVDRDETVILRDSSIHNRQDKGYQLTAQIGGVGPSLSSASGLQFGKFLTPDQLIFLEVTNGRSTAGFLSSNSEVNSQSVGVHFKQHSGNSFYWRGGVDYRKFHYKYNYVSIINSSFNSRSEFEGTSTAFNFQIGNQWQWENFTLGCDWVGISVPIQSDISKDEVDSQYQSDRTSQDEDIRRTIKETNLNLLRFYLGFSF